MFVAEPGLKPYLFVSCSLDVAHAGDRNQERTFKQWLTKCHTELDKSIRFEKLADDDIQARFQLLALTCIYAAVQSTQKSHANTHVS